MAERLLHQVNRRAAVEGVAGVGVAQPVGADRILEARPSGGGADDPPHLRLLLSATKRIEAANSWRGHQYHVERAPPKPMRGTLGGLDALRRFVRGLLEW